MPAIRVASRCAYLNWICAVAILLHSGHAWAGQLSQSSTPTEICVVIRAYRGHGGASQQGLYNLITSLQRQSNPR